MRHWPIRCLRSTDSFPPQRRIGQRARRHRVWIVCVALVPMAVGCVTRGNYQRVKTERDSLESARVRLERRVEHLEAAQKSLTSERDKLFDQLEDQRIANQKLQLDVRRLQSKGSELEENLEQTAALLAQREAEIAAMRGTYDALVADLQEEVAAGQIEIERLSSSLNLNLSQGVLFPNASANVSPSGVAVLRKLAGQLRGINYQIEIIGHTDNVPIGRAYPSNWELAGARASSVVRLLADAGVDPARMSAVSRGEYAPIASNETAEGRAKNRRIEIRLTPDPKARGDGAGPTALPVDPGEPLPGQ